MKPKHELHAFFKSFSNRLAEDYKAFRARVLEDPGTSGDQGEESWARLLREWLPEGYSVVTKGRILGASGEASPQIDVIVLKPSYPKFLKAEKYYLLDGVAAAFECKLTLKSGHLEKVMRNAKVIASLSPKQIGSPKKELMSPLIYGVLAHSHTWKSDAKTVVAELTNKIHNIAKQASEPRELPELICIADLAGWRLSHSTTTHYIFGDYNIPDATTRESYINHLKSLHADCSHQEHRDAHFHQLWVDKPHSEYMVQFYPEHIDHEAPDQIWEKFTPVGAFIGAMYDKLAYRDESLLNISHYFKSVHIPGSNGGVKLAGGKLPWPSNVINKSTWESPRRAQNGWDSFFF
ncbi:DUF6602 domain-containing protein [Pseudomonas fulva]|uniref:DUF6602 domain-containing protein n=1 Tax=Pseudomonas fulva TaxID=47880 RepID=UPI0012B58390|nr:DUF6602 domain-containing protein [Pseudomonas fulva]